MGGDANGAVIRGPTSAPASVSAAASASTSAVGGDTNGAVIRVENVNCHKSLLLSTSSFAAAGLLASERATIENAEVERQLNSIGIGVGLVRDVNDSKPRPTGSSASASVRDDFQVRRDVHLQSLRACEFKCVEHEHADQVELVPLAGVGLAAQVLADELVLLADRSRSASSPDVVEVVLLIRISQAQNDEAAQASPLATWLATAMSIAEQACRDLEVRVRVIREIGSAALHDAATARPFFDEMNAMLVDAGAGAELPTVVLSAEPARLVRAHGDKDALCALLARARAHGVRFLALCAPRAMTSLRRFGGLPAHDVDAAVPFDVVATSASAATECKALYGVRSRDNQRNLTATRRHLGGRLSAHIDKMVQLVVRCVKKIAPGVDIAVITRTSPYGAKVDPRGALVGFAQGAGIVGAVAAAELPAGSTVLIFSGDDGRSAPKAADDGKTLDELELMEWPMWSRIFGDLFNDPGKRLVVITPALDRLTRDPRYFEALMRLVHRNQLIVIVLNVSRELFNDLNKEAAHAQISVIDIMLPLPDDMLAQADDADIKLLDLHGRLLTWLYKRQTSRDFAGTWPNLRLPCILHAKNAEAMLRHVKTSAAAYRRVFEMSAPIRNLHFDQKLRLRRLRRSLKRKR